MSVLKALTRSATYVSLQHALCHLYICPSVQTDGHLRTVLKALTESPIAKEVKDLLTLLEQHDAQSTCYVSGSNKISQR